MRILVVDDLATNRKLLRVNLEPEGHQVAEASDGLAALAILSTGTFDAVISDILMPNMDGYRLCLEIRKNPRLKDLPFIICSSTYTSPADAKLALEVGADKYLKKPCPRELLLETLHEILNRQSQHQHRAISISEERLVMKEYNEVLVHKLEEKNRQLEAAQAELVRINRDLEARVRERTAELEQANADLEAFNHSVSHDLRGPITEVQGYAQLLQASTDEQFSSNAREFAAKIVSAGQRMEKLIRQFLKLARTKDIHRESCNLSLIAEGILDRICARHPQRKAELVITPGLEVHADAQLIEIALENLLTNAWKYTARNAISQIQIGTIQNPDQPASRAFFVRDNGAGFDMAQAGRMFQPFQRLHSDSDYSGTGVGLTIVQRIVARHGGRIWAEGQPGKGATFYFTLDE